MKRKIYKLLSNTNQGLFALALAAFSGTAFSQTTYTFNYTGSTQTISLPPGNYSITCWGADGGNANNGSVSMFGGKGGYATGVYSLAATTTLNIYAGGHGGNASGASNIGGGGGGMSDIAPASNSTLIIIAAGGGGGATSGGGSEASTGGDGGGLVGGTAIDGTGVSSGTAASGGSQTAGGIAQAGSYGAGFAGGYGYGGGSSNGSSNPASPSGTMHAGGGAGGNGGNGGWNGGGGGCTSTGGNDHAAGGGAGYYGGGGGRGDGGAGGGGSSYIGGVTSGTTIMFGQSGFVSNPDVTGNGRIHITELCSISLYAVGSANSLNPIMCSGQSLTLTTDAVSNYSWSTGATTSSLVVSPTTNTVYALTATSPSNCTASRNISITVSSGLPVLSISNPSNNICLGKTVSLTATGALTYTWANPGVVNGQTFTPSSTAIYTVTGQNGCGISTATTTVTVAPLSVSAMASPTLVCEGSPSTLTAVSAVTNYTWMPNSLFGSSIVVAPMSNLVYTVVASDGTCSGTQTVAVNTKVTPTLQISGTKSTICEGDQVVITAQGANSYTWSNNMTGPSITVTPSQATLYSVTGENSVGCFDGDQWIVVVSSSPTITISASKMAVCAGQSVTLNASGGNGYVWTGGPSSSTLSSYVVTPNVTSVYSVTGSHSSNTCTAMKSITIDAVVPNPTLPTATQVCIGNTVALNASGADLYVWNSVPTGSVGVYVLQPQASTTVVLVATTKSLNLSCPVTHSIPVNVNPLPTLSVSPSIPVVCRGESNTLTATGAQTFTWTGSVTGNNIVITPSANITYSVMGTDGNGCENIAYYQAKTNPCTGVEEMQGNGSQVIVFPNPSNGTFTIKAETFMELRLVNQVGQELMKFKLEESGDFSYEFKNLKPGLYFIQQENPSGAVVQKIVVN